MGAMSSSRSCCEKVFLSGVAGVLAGAGGALPAAGCCARAIGSSARLAAIAHAAMRRTLEGLRSMFTSSWLAGGDAGAFLIVALTTGPHHPWDHGPIARRDPPCPE